MDRVLLGRVLGRGARLAARTAVEAVQAATAPEPVATPQAAQRADPRTAPQSVRPTSQPVILPPLKTAASPARAVQAASTARAGMMSPLKTASKALWHEVTGSFFALFAASFSVAVWHTRANAVSAAPNDRYRFYAFCALTLLFAYFSVSSFLLARKRG